MSTLIPSTPPTLILVAHGTRSEPGARTTARLRDALGAARPGVPVELCFLDVRQPDLAATLDATAGPCIVVPALLSTGYHVRSDIPGVLADRPGVTLVRHLGPDPALARAGAERLAAALGEHPPAAAVALVATGSTDPLAAGELQAAAGLLAEILGRPVYPLTIDDALGANLDALGPVDVSPYLLAEGAFADRISAAAGDRTVAPVLGVHPEVVDLVLRRYDSGRREPVR